jgi:rhodanese-related sulfurtransferase
MGGSPDCLNNVFEDATSVQEELDRRIFCLRTLFETSRELDALIQPKKILDTFLLMTMGPLGFTRGAAALVNTGSGALVVTSRGFTEAENDKLKEDLPQACNRYFPKRDSTEISVPRVQILKDNFGDCPLLQDHRGVLVLWSMNEEYCGIIGLGSKISGESLDENDSDILLNLTNILVSALARAIYTTNIQQLNSDLQKKNLALQDALNQAERAREELDRRVYHLKTLSDLNSELSPIIRIDDLLENFLLVAMGTFGVSKGIALFYDRETKEVKTAVRGLEHGKDLSPESVDRLLYKSFGGAEKRALTPMSVTRITAAREIFAETGIGADIETGVLYVINQTTLGVVGLGPSISGTALSEEERELLLTHIRSLMVYLKNAGAFEKIQILNEDLVQRNEELRRTIAELTEARLTIAILEKARAQIKSLIQREMERVGRASLPSLIMILVLATVVGVLFNFASPQRIPLLPEVLFRTASATVDAPEAKSLLDSAEAVLVDARPKELYDRKHIKGAINIPSALFDIIYAMKLADLDEDKEIIVYGRHISKRYDEEVAYRLKQQDHENVRVLAGGLHAWEHQGYQTEQ